MTLIVSCQFLMLLGFSILLDHPYISHVWRSRLLLMFDLVCSLEMKRQYNDRTGHDVFEYLND